METRQLIKMLAGAVAIAAVVIAIASLIPSKAKAESTQGNQTVTELGVAMKGWAMAFGADIKKGAETTRESFLNDVERIKQSEFMQYQKKNLTEAREQLARNKTQVVDLFAMIGNALSKIMVGGKNNDGKNQK